MNYPPTLLMIKFRSRVFGKQTLRRSPSNHILSIYNVETSLMRFEHSSNCTNVMFFIVSDFELNVTFCVCTVFFSCISCSEKQAWVGKLGIGMCLRLQNFVSLLYLEPLKPLTQCFKNQTDDRLSKDVGFLVEPLDHWSNRMAELN